MQLAPKRPQPAAALRGRKPGACAGAAAAPTPAAPPCLPMPETPTPASAGHESPVAAAGSPRTQGRAGYTSARVPQGSTCIPKWRRARRAGPAAPRLPAARGPRGPSCSGPGPSPLHAGGGLGLEGDGLLLGLVEGGGLGLALGLQLRDSLLVLPADLAEWKGKGKGKGGEGAAGASAVEHHTPRCCQRCLRCRTDCSRSLGPKLLLELDFTGHPAAAEKWACSRLRPHPRAVRP